MSRTLSTVRRVTMLGIPVESWLLGASVLAMLLGVPHVVEDFAFGIHTRFGLPLLALASVVALAYASQVLAAALVARRDRRGYALSLVLALVWLVGALVEHLPELLFVWPYRSGWISKGLEVGLIATTAAWAALAAIGLRRAG
jgi:hypothetical protein